MILSRGGREQHAACVPGPGTHHLGEEHGSAIAATAGGGSARISLNKQLGMRWAAFVAETDRARRRFWRTSWPGRASPRFPARLAFERPPAELARRLVRLLASQLDEVELRIDEIDAQIMAWHKANPVSQRLAAIPASGH
jgi:transposase